MFTLYYATHYIFQSLKLMAFQLEWPHLWITIFLLQMNSTPRWGEKSTSLNSREWFHTDPLSYHIPTRMPERTQTHRLSLHSWLNMWMSESFNKRGNNRETLSIRGGYEERYELLPLWIDWHVLLFLSLSRFKYTLLAWVGNGNCKATICYKTTYK